MPGGKRTKKSVSYTEHNDDDDDDDFVTKGDNSKKTRETKIKDHRTEMNSSARQAPRRREEKLSKAEQEQLDLALQLSKGTTASGEVSIELPIITDENESTNSPSVVSNEEEPTVVEDESDENVSPKSKRMKRDEEESNNEVEEEEEEEEEEPVLPKKPVAQTERAKKNSEVPTVTSIDLNSARSTTRGQQRSSVPSSDTVQKKSNAPIGFPTTKIVIPSLQTSRVGLSRKSSAIKSLHPNLNQRIVHE